MIDQLDLKFSNSRDSFSFLFLILNSLQLPNLASFTHLFSIVLPNPRGTLLPNLIILPLAKVWFHSRDIKIHQSTCFYLSLFKHILLYIWFILETLMNDVVFQPLNRYILFIYLLYVIYKQFSKIKGFNQTK